MASVDLAEFQNNGMDRNVFVKLEHLRLMDTVNHVMKTHTMPMVTVSVTMVSMEIDINAINVIALAENALVLILMNA